MHALCRSLDPNPDERFLRAPSSTGFIEWKTSPFLRRIITRLISMIPAIAVAVSVGRNGIDTLLVASQVVLSIVLPFVIFPLVFICSSNIMVVNAPPESVEPEPAPSHVEGATPEVERVVELGASEGEGGEVATGFEVVSFKSPMWATCLGYFIFALVVVANSVSPLSPRDLVLYDVGY